MILILTHPDDEHANYVATQLEERGASFVRFNPAEFPRAAALSFAYTPQGGSYATLHLGEEHIDLRQLRAVWNRRPEPPVAHETLGDERVREFVQQECRTFMQDLWQALDCLWLPAPPATVRQTQYKASQLQVAGQLGFDVPPTLITNNAPDLLDFYSEHQGKIVSKLAGFSFFDTVGDTFTRYTEMVTPRDLAYARSLRYCPMIFQAYVPKRLELRVTVVGQRVFAAAIHSQSSNHTRYDWRRYDDYQTPYLPYDLPHDVQQRCVALVERLGLCYGALDLVLTPDGRYVFLEINPSGQYLWIEVATGLPITAALCELLIQGAPVTRAAA
jgi:glutathione synthase/RimK-type ligase-like ATP-grasp enzyme